MQGRFDEAMLLWHKAAGLGLDIARWNLVLAYLIRGEDKQAATHLALVPDALLSLRDFPDEISFIRAVRDPESGKATLDAWVAKQEEAARIMNDARGAYDLYLAFGYLDDFAALVDKFNVPGPVWTDGEDMESFGMTFDREGFVAHPSFIRRAKAGGMTDLWDTRGAPDHCSKESGYWVCQ